MVYKNTDTLDCIWMSLQKKGLTCGLLLGQASSAGAGGHHNTRSGGVSGATQSRDGRAQQDPVKVIV